MEKVTSGMAATTISGAELAPKRPAGTRGTQVAIKTNLAKIDLKPNQPFYKYDVEIHANFTKNDGSVVSKEISKPCKDDATSQMRKQACVSVYKEVLRANRAFFAKADTFYDRCKILFSLGNFKLNGTKTFTVNPNPAGYEDAVNFTFNLKSCADSFSVTTNDLARVVNARVDLQDKTILEALNLVCSSNLFNTPEQYVSYGQGTHFLFDPFNGGHFGPDELPYLPDGKYMGVAVCKKVSVLEGENKKATAYLSTEIKKSSFHQDNMPLLDKLRAYGFGRDPRSFNASIRQYKQVLKGLMVYASYKTNKYFPIVDLTERTAGSTKFKLDNGGEMTVAQYMTREKGVQITMPDLFMVVANQRGKQCFYPVEALRVAPNQRVVQSQATPQENEIAIRASATLPAIRLRQTEAMKDALMFNPGNRELVAAGVRIENNLTVVKGRHLPAPQMQFGKNSTEKTNNEGCRWKGNRQFYCAEKLTNWMVIGHFTKNDSNRLDVNRFVGGLTREMAKFGLAASQPKIKGTRGERAALEPLFAVAKNEDVQLMMFVSSDSLKDHDEIKRLELKHQVVTQDLRLNNICKMVERNQVQTWENIIMKTNIKLGGFNFQVNMGDPKNTNDKTSCWINDATRLFFGLEMSHPAALSKSEQARGSYTRPSVLGYACNTGRHPQQFIGDYLYVEPRSTEPMGQMIEKIVPECLKSARANRNALPQHLIFLIHGVSEGQYSEIATTYAKYVRKGLDSLSTALQPKITFVAVSKEHNERLYPEKISGEKAAQQNVMPGTVVDTVIVNPAINEFYLQSHSAFQGTGKAPKYTVILDSANMPMDVIQGMMHGLCFLHGIVNMTVSMPAPLMVADRCAKRGNKNYNAESASSATIGNIDYAQLNTELTNSGRKLRKVRYNA